MGFGAVAGHLVLFMAIFSAGVLMAGAINNSMSAQLDAREEFSDRLRAGAHADYELNSSNYTSGPDRTYANFTNEGSNEVPLDEVTLLIDGTETDTSNVQRFRVSADHSSNLWLPGEELEIMTEGRGDVDVTIAGPYGVQAHRRN